MNAAPGKSYPSRRRGPQANTLTAFLCSMSSSTACRAPYGVGCERNETKGLGRVVIVDLLHWSGNKSTTADLTTARRTNLERHQPSERPAASARRSVAELACEAATWRPTIAAL
jgi:hypothetical protein